MLGVINCLQLILKINNENKAETEVVFNVKTFFP